MFLDLRAQGPHLTCEQAKLLDDEYFLSTPLAHFPARITMLLEANRHRDSRVDPENASEFYDALGLTDPDGLLEFSDRERGTQVAIDALALRHQAAEALARFTYATAVSKPKPGDAPCTWLAVAESPTRLIEVVKANAEAINSDSFTFLSLLFPAGTRIEGDALIAAETAQAWTNHAIQLLTDKELSINAAHNKLKHGIAISTRDDVRIEFTIHRPNTDGTIPLSAFGEGKSVPIFDRPILTYLSRPVGKPKFGVESISLRVDVPVVLAETWMIANVYAAMFHIAARKGLLRV